MKCPIPLLVAFCVSGPLLSTAAPINCADVSANPAWLLHVDCDALRQTYIGKYLLFQLDKPTLHSNMMAFRSVFSFDIRTQLHGITVYTDRPTTQDNVLVTYADFDPARIIALVTAGEAAESATNHQNVIYSWIDKNKNPDNDGGIRYYAVVQNGRVIKTTNKKSILGALAVIDGAAPNFLAGKALPELAGAGGGTFVQGSARNLDCLGSVPNADLLKMSKQVSFHASETNEILTAVLTAKFDNEDTAKQVSIAAQGLIAMLSLQKDNPKAAKLAGGMSVKYEGTTVTVTLSTPSQDMMAAIKAYSAKKDTANAGAGAQ